MKHVILEAYSFNNSTKTVTVIGKNIRREQLLLITNVTSNTVIYNFSDPALGFTSYTNAVDTTTGQETTTIVLSYNTSAMNNTDKLSILVEETYTEIVPAEVMRDPVDKLRVSTPQSLIDTDFEYGTQPTKWEALNLLNNRPSAFYDITAPLVITNVTSSAKVVTVATTTPPAVGTPFFIQGTTDVGNVDGWWIVETVSAGVNFTFTVINTPTTTALYDATKTYIFPATFFTGAAIPTGAAAITLSGTVATVTTTTTHGLRVGDGIYIRGATGMTGTLNSSWVVATTPTTNTFTFACTATGTITTVTNATLYPRALGYVEHRPFDGGVQFSNVSPFHGYQVIRQTRRQFRYQSGKGMQWSTGSTLKPSIQVDSITSSGTVATVTTKFTHGLAVGAAIRVSGALESAYNGTGVIGGGTYVVTTAPTPTTFTYNISSATTSPASGFPLTVSPQAWYGSANRIGLFDQQNGIFFEFDGVNIYAVRRSSTTQTSGVVAVTNGSSLVTGTGTRFSSQLKPGDYIVIRGMSYIVQTITSDTQLYISPEYRGTTASNCIVSKTIDNRYAQSTWNIDKMDGTGSSLYNLDLTRMQMFYIDYTWYGAGAVRFGFKNNRGEVIYCHRIPNNNINTEAYMRSGNLVARYETNTLPVRTFLTGTLSSGITASMSVADTSNFPSAGTLAVVAAADTGGAIEYVNYTGKTSTTFTGLTRNVTGGTGSATTFTVTGVSAASTGGTAPITVESYSPAQASTISHWGSAVIMDGRYDDDKSIQFNYGMSSPVVYANTATRYPVFSIRLSPSVDNGLTGLLGAREIINRMQVNPVGCGVYPTVAGVRVELVLNARVSAGTFGPIGGSSLSQYALHPNTSTISGGESIFTFFAPAGSVSTQDISKMRDLGNSILGGGTNNTVPNTNNNIYPDGPDILTVVVTPLASNASVAARLSWTEAQA